MKKLPRVCVAVALFVASGGLAQTVACSGVGGALAGGQADADPEAAATGEDGAAIDGDVASDAGVIMDADVDVPPSAPTKVGRILVGQTITISGGQTFYSSYASAMFYETSPSSGSSACTYDHIGACHVYDCPLGGPTPDPGDPRYASAGTVSITGGLTTYDLEIKPDSYASVSSQQLLFDAGTVLRVSSTGGEVPPFSNKTLTVPSAAFTVQAPSLGASLSIARAQALAVSWSGANGRDVQVNVSTVNKSVRSVSIACVFPGTASTASIPAAAMSKLLPTDAATKGYVSVGAPIETTFSAGPWAVSFALNTSPASSAFTTTN